MPLARITIATLVSLSLALVSLSAHSTPAITHFWISGTNATARVGIGVAGGGDVDGDGFSDLVFSIDRMGSTEAATAGLGIIYGSTNILSNPRGAFVPVTKPRSGFGNPITIGDFNGDGFTDVAAGARRLEVDTTNQGGLFVFYGGKQGLNTNTTLITSTNKHVSFFGTVVSAADLNGDGFSDLVASATHENRAKRIGHVTVYYGSSRGLQDNIGWNSLRSKFSLSSQVAAVADLNGDRFHDLVIANSGITSPPLITVLFGSKNGINNDNFAEIQVAPAGQVYRIASFPDYNQDGRNEVIITVANVSGPGSRDVVLLEGGNDLNTTKRHLIESIPWNSDFGSAVASIGDVDKDGLNDLLLGAPEDHTGGRSAGVVHLYRGKNGLVSPAEWAFEGGRPRLFFGYAASAAGDLNGDGVSDFVIGSGLYNGAGTSQAGRVDVFFGSAQLPQGMRWKVPEDGAINWLNVAKPVPSVAIAPLSPKYSLWISAAALSFLLLLWVYHYKSQKLVLAERERLARDLHDGLGASLARISLLSKGGPPQKESEALSLAVKDAVSAAQQAVWLVNPQNDTLENLATFVCDHIEKVCEHTGVKCLCDADLNLPKIKLKPDVRKNVFLTVNEALTNALKHSGADTLTLKINYLKGNLALVIEDDGCGFNPEGLKSNGNGLGNMRRRIEEVSGEIRWTSDSRGTVVTITIPL